MNRVITISREFGSGGRELGKRLAEDLGIAYYDREIISAIAEKSSLAESYVDQIVEHHIVNIGRKCGCRQHCRPPQKKKPNFHEISLSIAFQHTMS